MNKTYTVLNQLLVDIFNDILIIEQNALKGSELGDLSITEVHTIEAIGKQSGRTMSEVAQDLKVTVGTLTIMVDKLVKKGYAERYRSEIDRRVVYVKLTHKGELVYKLHERFHHEMIRNIISDLNENEEEILISSLEKLKEFFKKKYELILRKE
ncbi:Multiple antibiotic resistance protein MarR [Caloramator mitchellensis]|uniref:Multiple antibiotic resistance protein MarR n=1 Tax=Caloramator mitchellensis TaxID=908809 RepID=A0A0R3JWD2_CALMK|nr:MarR family transcriptional regulator [Caloramator mitchellensis]KRQ87863.1 Multiple antibiotic resistance protein MarR [Caloramator mitchellensis]